MSRLKLVVLVDDLLALQRGQATQLHVEDRAGLDLVDLEQVHQPGAGVLHRRAAPDQRDDLVERVQRLELGRARCAPAPRPWRSRNRVRRTMTSIWWRIQWRDELVQRSVRGTPSTSASMLAPKFACSWVCL